ncbi:MAG: polysaccharide deacetylase family protein [Desulfuromonadaceae bacterium]
MNKLLLFLLLLVWAGTAWASQANVFVYHRFGDDRYPSTNISLPVFAEQLELLKTKDCAVLTLGAVVARLKQRQPLPPRCVVLTIDDAYRSVLTGAMPLLRQYGYPATLFVNTAAVGSQDYLSWDEIRALAAEGIEIGNHSASHPYLLNREPGEDDAAWEKRVTADLLRARQVLNRELGEQQRLLAYPYGEYSTELVKLTRALGFAGAASQHSGVISPATDLFILPRFPMGGPYATLAGFREKLALRALEVRVLAPADPLDSGRNPPLLVLDILSREADLSRLQCYVAGQPECDVNADTEHPGRYRIQARQPLNGRRGKYTLTAPARQGGGWFWFSQLWIYPQR